MNLAAHNVTIEAGDTVLHLPSQEEWWLLDVKGEYVYPAGWPKSRGLLKDCVLVEKGSPEMLRQVEDEAIAESSLVSGPTSGDE